MPADRSLREPRARDRVALAHARAGTAAAALRWVARVDGALPGARNMARDEALALALEPGAAALRLYRWDVPTLSLGRNEPAVGRLDPRRARALGVALVRRPTGGRSVLHRRELTYAVALPASVLGPRDAYRWINERLAAALASLGVPADIAGGPPGSAGSGPRLPRPDAGPCFQGAAPGEVEVAGRKLVGSAQVRIRGTSGDVLLQHGSILIEDDQGLLAELGIPGDVGAPAALTPLLGRAPAEGELEVALLAAFGACAEEISAPFPGERELELRYRSEEWTWRR